MIPGAASSAAPATSAANSGSPRLRLASMIEGDPGMSIASATDLWELVWAIEGDGVATIADHRIDMPVGSVLVIPPGIEASVERNAGRWGVVTFEDDHRAPDPLVRHLAPDAVVLDLLRHTLDLYGHAPDGWSAAAGHVLAVVLHALETLPAGPLPAAPADRLALPETISRALAAVRSVWGARQPIPQPAVARLAAAAGVTPSRLNRIFVEEFGIAPSAIFRTLRMRDAAMSLTDTTEPIVRIALHTGFTSTLSFSRAFRAATGLSPAVFREQRPAIPPLDPRLRVVAAYVLPYPSAHGWGYVPRNEFDDQ